MPDEDWHIDAERALREQLAEARVILEAQRTQISNLQVALGNYRMLVTDLFESLNTFLGENSHE